jgi:hypothetical protein
MLGSIDCSLELEALSCSYGMDGSMATQKITQSFLKLWLTMRLGFGLLFLDARFLQRYQCPSTFKTDGMDINE